MASMFDDLEAALSGAISGAFAEAAVIRPRVSTQYVERADDPNRPSATITGIYSAGPADDQLKGSSKGGEFVGSTRLSSETAEFWIAKAQVDLLGWMPSKGDALTLTARSGAPVFSISKVQPSDMGDLNLILVREDQPS